VFAHFCSCGLTINSLGYGAAIVVVSLIGQVKIYMGFQNLVFFSLKKCFLFVKKQDGILDHLETHACET